MLGKMVFTSCTKHEVCVMCARVCVQLDLAVVSVDPDTWLSCDDMCKMEWTREWVSVVSLLHACMHTHTHTDACARVRERARLSNAAHMQGGRLQVVCVCVCVCVQVAAHVRDALRMQKPLLVGLVSTDSAKGRSPARQLAFQRLVLDYLTTATRQGLPIAGESSHALCACIIAALQHDAW